MIVEPIQNLARLVCRLSFFLLFNILTAAVMLIQPAIADRFSPTATYTVCFTPGEDCTAKIVEQLNQAKRDVYVQAYSFTSQPIAKALLDAKRRGVTLYIVLDKSQLATKRYSSAVFFAHAKIPVWIDDDVSIAHNKVMIIDHERVITGSFNFTRAAQYKNAENVLIIRDAGLVQRYVHNFLRRKDAAKLFVT